MCLYSVNPDVVIVSALLVEAMFVDCSAIHRIVFGRRIGIPIFISQCVLALPVLVKKHGRQKKSGKNFKVVIAKRFVARIVASLDCFSRLPSRCRLPCTRSTGFFSFLGRLYPAPTISFHNTLAFLLFFYLPSSCVKSWRPPGYRSLPVTRSYLTHTKHAAL